MLSICYVRYSWLFTKRAISSLKRFLFPISVVSCVELHGFALALVPLMTPYTWLIWCLEVPALIATAEHLIQFGTEPRMSDSVEIRIKASSWFRHYRGNHGCKRRNWVSISADPQQRNNAIGRPGEAPLLKEIKIVWTKLCNEDETFYELKFSVCRQEEVSM